MWYGTRDQSVPMATAEWLQTLVPKAISQKVNGRHELYFLSRQRDFRQRCFQAGGDLDKEGKIHLDLCM